MRHRGAVKCYADVSNLITGLSADDDRSPDLSLQINGLEVTVAPRRRPSSATGGRGCGVGEGRWRCRHCGRERAATWSASRATTHAGPLRFEAPGCKSGSKFMAGCTLSRRDELNQTLPIVRAQLFETISTRGALTSMP